MQSLIQFLRIFFASFLSFPWLEAIGVIKIIIIILTIILFVGWILLLPFAKGPPGKFGPKFIYQTKSKKHGTRNMRERIKQSWQELSAGPPETAVPQADELIGELLRNMDVPGEDVTDRMNALEGENITSSPRLKKAHAIKVRIDKNENVSEEEIREALTDYEAFLREIGIL